MGLLSLIATTPSACTELVDQGIPAHVHAVLQETHPDTRLFLASIAAVCSLACHTSNNASAGLADALANDMFRAAGMAADLREPEQSQLLQYSSVGLLFMMWPTPRALSPVQISNVASMMLYPDVAALPSVQLLFCSLGQVHRPRCDPFAMLCSDDDSPRWRLHQVDATSLAVGAFDGVIPRLVAWLMVFLRAYERMVHPTEPPPEELSHYDELVKAAAPPTPPKANRQASAASLAD